jgi:hypothetical protein
MSEFKWTEDLIQEYGRQVSYAAVSAGRPLGDIDLNHIFDDFKASKQPKQEWEILEGYDPDIPSVKPHKWQTDPHIPFGNCEENKCNILSVKRLSDGEVFTIGDVIGVAHQPELMLPIARFEIGYDNEMRTISSKETGSFNWGLKIIKKLQPLIPVLLTPSQIEKLKQLLK